MLLKEDRIHTVSQITLSCHTFYNFCNGQKYARGGQAWYQEACSLHLNPICGTKLILNGAAPDDITVALFVEESDHIVFAGW